MRAEDAHPEGAAAVAESCCAPALWGWSPPPLPADTPLKRRVDRLMPRTGAPALVYYLAVIGLLNLAPHLPTRGYLATEGLAALAAGAWCGLNFWRCRHAHCLVSGGGWLGLALLAGSETVFGHSWLRGHEQAAFLAVLVVALVFEGVWVAVRGSNALAPWVRAAGSR